LLKPRKTNHFKVLQIYGFCSHQLKKKKKEIKGKKGVAALACIYIERLQRSANDTTARKKGLNVF